MKHKKSPIANLPHGIAVAKADNGNGGEYWCVSAGKKFTGGKTIRKYFPNLEGAREWIFGPEVEEIKAVLPGGIVALEKDAGTAIFALTPAQINEATNAFRRLENYNLSLTEAISIAISHSRPEAGAIAFPAAITLFLRHPRKRPLASSTADAYRNSINLLAADFPKKVVHDVSKTDIEEFLVDDEWEPSTQAHHLRNLRVFFGWAVKAGRTGFNPTDEVPEPVNDKEPIALSSEEAARLLVAAELHAEMLPGIVLGLFGGLRTSEIRRLDWREIGEREIEIKPGKTKTRRRRMVTVSETLKAWLAVCRKASGPIVPDDWRVGFEKVIGAAGYQVGPIREGKKSLPPWPRNAMRHSFGSYYFALHRNETATAAEMGNSPAMVFAHYRRVFPAQEVEAFWALRPSKRQSKRKISKQR